MPTTIQYQGISSYPLNEIQYFAHQVTENIEKVSVGKADVVENLIIALLCEGHVLLADEINRATPLHPISISALACSSASILPTARR